ncbi:hypothetical protein FKM82_019186 [Ascaphus truei]
MKHIDSSRSEKSQNTVVLESKERVPHLSKIASRKERCPPGRRLKRWFQTNAGTLLGFSAFFFMSGSIARAYAPEDNVPSRGFKEANEDGAACASKLYKYELSNLHSGDVLETSISQILPLHPEVIL